MKTKFLFTIYLLIVLVPLRAQNYHVCDQEALNKSITRCSKPYKVLYIFCTYCHPAKYNMYLDSLVSQHHSDSIAFFPITCQNTEEVLPYIVKHDIKNFIYFVKTKKNGKRIGMFVFDNPIKQACEVLERYDSTHIENVGAGGYIILDENNRPIMWSDFKEKKYSQDFMLLRNFILAH